MSLNIMNKKNIFLIVSILVVLLVLFFVLFKVNKNSNSTENNPETPAPIVGGDRDPHGCIGSAGYSWCEVKSKCLRVWEEKCEAENAPTLPTEGAMNENVCQSKGGVWFTDNNTCEINSLSKEECTAKGGEWNDCASACRHDPKAEFCTMQCVLTCTFK